MSYIHGKVVWGLSAAAVATGLWFGRAPSLSEAYRSPSGESVNSVEWVELKKTLLELRVTWKPSAKARIIERTRRWGPTFEAPILWLLSKPNHDLFEDAIALAGELELDSAHGPIVQLAKSGSDSTRAVAIAAAEQLQPWAMEELMDFLEDDSVNVQRAAMTVAGARRHPPVAAILTALASPAEPLREAALAALPRQVSADDRQTLFFMVEDAEPEVALTLMRAFSVIELDDETEVFLTSLLSGVEPARTKVALDVLTKKASRLQDPYAVWDLVTDGGTPLEIRAAAFRCLEKTRSYDLGAIGDGPPFTEPVLMYYAARCMLDAGERTGAGLLLELLKEAEMTGDEQAELVAAARRLLSQLSGTAAGIDAWSQWYWYGGPVRVRRLPDPPTGW